MACIMLTTFQKEQLKTGSREREQIHPIPAWSPIKSAKEAVHYDGECPSATGTLWRNPTDE
jgi:hypothetical protein